MRARACSRAQWSLCFIEHTGTTTCDLAEVDWPRSRQFPANNDEQAGLLRACVRARARPCVRSSVRPSMRPSVHASVRPCVRLYVRASVRLCVRPSGRPSGRPSVSARACLCAHACVRHRPGPSTIGRRRHVIVQRPCAFLLCRHGSLRPSAPRRPLLGSLVGTEPSSSRASHPFLHPRRACSDRPEFNALVHRTRADCVG